MFYLIAVTKFAAYFHDIFIYAPLFQRLSNLVLTAVGVQCMKKLSSLRERITIMKTIVHCFK